MNNIDDKILVEGVIRGDKNAFEKLFNRYNKIVYYFAYSYLKNQAKSENLVQDIFLKIWKGRENLDPEKNFKNFVFTISKNRILDGFKKEANEKKYNSYLSHKEYSFVTENTYNDVVLQELQRLLSSIEDELPPKRGNIYRLSRHQHLSNKKIAESLDISEKTVENQITLALKYIKERLSELYNVPIDKLYGLIPLFFIW